MRRERWSTLVTFCVALVVLLVAARVGGESEWFDSIGGICHKAFLEVRLGGSARTPGIMAPNNRHIAWSVGTWQRTPEVFHSAVIVHDTASGSSETVLRSGLNKVGRLVGPDGKVRTSANADQLCVVDWSRDSRYLLVRELIGPTESDNTITDVWVYDVQKKRRSVTPQSSLRRAIERYWIRKGANFHEVFYDLGPAGWEDSKVPRPAFTATALEGSPTSFPPEFDGFLGAWSVSLSGGAPKLLAESRTANVVKQNGRIVPHPTSWTSGEMR